MMPLKRIAVIITKVLLGFVLLTALLFALFAGVMLWQSKNIEIEYGQLSVLESSDGRYLLTIEIGNPVLPYGPHSVVITVKHASDSEVIVAKKTRLANDGMRITSNNISARWTDRDTARVCIRGDEQRDADILINMRSRTVTEKHEPC